MRLYNIYYVCCTCRDGLDRNVGIGITRDSGNRITEYRVIGWSKLKAVLNQLNSISFMRDAVQKVYFAIDPLDRDDEQPLLSSQRKEKFDIAIDELKISLETIEKLYESLDIGESKAGIDVKIPKCSSLKEYTDYLKEIEFIFSQCPYLLRSDEEIKFNNVDVGSQWLSFILATSGTFVILNNLAALVNKALEIKSKFLLLKQQNELLKAMRLKNEVGEEVTDVFKKMKQMLLSDSVNDLESELGELQDGEERGKVEKTLEKMVMLMDKGVEIYSSIETPNEIKALFPANENNPILPDNIIKLLEKKDEK
nr:MAG TPA: hypothetical protein [Bacteriophage sp.]